MKNAIKRDAAYEIGLLDDMIAVRISERREHEERIDDLDNQIEDIYKDIRRIKLENDL